MKTQATVSALMGAILLGGIGASAFAETAMSETVVAEADKWQFQLSPLFLWGISLRGDSTVGGQTAPLDLSFKDDILENLEAVFTVHFEARKRKFGLFAEYQYVDLQPSAQLRGGPTIDVGVINEMAELGGTYTVWGEARRRFEVLGGARWAAVDMDVSFENGPRIGASDESWWAGFVGGRLFWDLSPRWTFVGRGDIGAGEADLEWNISAIFDYRFNDLLSGFVGYRALYMDYSTGSGRNKFAWDVTQQGPLAGLSFHW